MWISRSSVCILVAWLAAAPAEAASGDPVQVKLSFCEPAPDLGSSGPGYAAPGYGNSSSDRVLRIRLAYHTKDAGDSATQALANTQRVELCYATAAGGVSCPGVSPWLIFNRVPSSGALPFPSQIADGFQDPAGTCAAIATSKDCEGTAGCYWNGACQPQTPLEETTPGLGHCSSTTSAACRSSGDCPVGEFCDFGAVTIDLPSAASGPADWAGATSEPVIFIRVNGGPASAVQAAQLWGACATPQRLALLPAANPHFEVIGVHPTTQPLGGPFDVCTQGSKVDWRKRANQTFGSTDAGRDVCISPDQGQAMGKIMFALDEAQRLRIQAALLPVGQQKYAWRNGDFGPTHVFLGPHLGSGGQSSSGAFYMNVDNIQKISLGASSTALDPDIFSLASHEYMHQLVAAWGREAPATAPLIRDSALLAEAIAVAVEQRLCALNVGLPGISSSCASGWKLGQFGGRGIYGSAAPYLTDPGQPLFDATNARAYSRGLVLLYAQEQYAKALGTQAHPAGTASLFPEPSPPTPLRERASDEGVDLIGRLLDAAGAAPPGWSTDAVVDGVLKQHLGRYLNPLLVDLQTALFLKDYSDTDPRWRLTWTQKNASTQSALLSEGKPFAVPRDLYGATCSCDPAQTGCLHPICDGLTRRKRALDSWARPCTDDANPACDAAPVLLPANGSVSGSNLKVPAWAAALLSVIPDGTWSGHKLKVSVVRKSGGTLVYRIFRVDQLSLAGDLTPVPICGSPPDWTCQSTVSGSEEGFVVDVAVSPKTREVLLLASALNQAGSFDWKFSPSVFVGNAKLPSTSDQVYVGGGFPPKPPIRLRAWDGVRPLEVGKPQLNIRLPGCPAGGSCELADQDLSFLGLVGGELHVLASIPAALIPPRCSGALDLEITVNETDPVRIPGGLRCGSVPPRQATVLALDMGSGMGAGPKLSALRRVIGGLSYSLVPPTPSESPDHILAIAVFRDDADTLVPLGPVDGALARSIASALGSLIAGGGTSVGDGALEGQSILATAFDALAPADRPDGLGMVVVADAPGSSEEPASTYYQADVAPPEDGNGPPWYPGPLTRRARQSAGLPLPRVATVALGADADDGELEALARTGNGRHLQVRSADSAPSSADLTTSLADAIGAAVASATGYERILAVTGSGRSIAVPVEPGVSELRVWLVSSLTGGAAASLFTPGGSLRTPSGADPQGDSIAYRIRDPEPGLWTLVPGVQSGEPHLFVEATARGGAGFIALADTEFADEPPADSAPYDPGAWTGSDVRIRAALRDPGPLTDCQVIAQVVDPAGAVHSLVLDDAAGPGDEVAGDGVYGALFTRTGGAGTYSAELQASCATPSAGELQRSARVDFALRSTADSDSDGLVDAWELRNELDPLDRSDASADQDDDGLDAWSELQLGTRPRDDDTDGGGESDGSEASNGRDPRDPRDDIVAPPGLALVPGNGAVYLHYGMDTEPVDVEVQKAATDTGPFSRVSGVFTRGSSFGLDVGLPNDMPVCYRARVDGPASSAWSRPTCVTPRTDPSPPLLELAGVATRSSAGQVSIPLRLEELEGHGMSRLPVDLATVQSPDPAQLRWWPAGGPTPRDGWQAFSETLSLMLPDATSAVQLQARDGAGNESGILTLALAKLWPPCGDLDDDGNLGHGDVAVLRFFLASGDRSSLPAGALERCAVIGSSQDCDLTTSVVLRRQIEASGLSPAIDPVCAAALSP